MTSANPAYRDLTFRRLALGGAGLLLALIAGYGSLGHRNDAIVLAAIPFGIGLFAYPKIAGVLAIALLPLPNSLTGNSGRAVSASDVLAVVACAPSVLQLIGRTPGAWSRLRNLAPVAPFLFAYAALLILNLAEHPNQNVAIGLAQRFILVGLPIVLGTMVLGNRARQWALAGFAGSAFVLALATIASRHVDALGVQKNPAGGFMASAILILLLRPEFRRVSYAAVPVLGVGLILGESRGALVGLILAAAVIVVLRGGGRGLLIKRIAPLVVLLAIAVSSAPGRVETRLTHTDASDDRAVFIRNQYKVDARALISEHPLTGVGVNNYQAGVGEFVTVDPHQVLYAETAMGGYPMGIGFIAMSVGAALMLIRRRRDPWSVLAITVQVAIISHSFADVYWVRGTPNLGWFLTSTSSPSRAAAGSDETARGDSRELARA